MANGLGSEKSQQSSLFSPSRGLCGASLERPRRLRGLEREEGVESAGGPPLAARLRPQGSQNSKAWVAGEMRVEGTTCSQVAAATQTVPNTQRGTMTARSSQLSREAKSPDFSMVTTNANV